MKTVKDLLTREFISPEEYNWLVEQNKLGLSALDLEKEEERLSKIQVLKLYLDYKLILKKEIGSFDSFLEIHQYILGDLYEWAGQVRNINLSKGNTSFLAAGFIKNAIHFFDNENDYSFESIIKKYSDLNFIHACYEGNGRAGRVWLDLTLFKYHNVMIDWAKISRNTYLKVMSDAANNQLTIDKMIELFENNLLKEVTTETVFSSTDMSYRYEGQKEYNSEDLYNEYIVKK